MEAIKKVLAPGKSKDDEIMYGDGSTPHVPGAFDEGVPQGENAPTLQTNPQSEKKEHGILSQISNPGGEKYDPARFGGTASYGDSTATGASTTGVPQAQTITHHESSTSAVSNPTTTSHNTSGQYNDPSTATSTTSGAPHQGTTTQPTSHSTTGRDAALGGLAGAGAATMAHDKTYGAGAGSSTSNPATSNLTSSTSASTQPSAYNTTSAAHAQPSTSTAAGSGTTSHPISTLAGTNTHGTHHHGASGDGLSHHVHNSVTEIPDRSAHNNHTVASANTLRGSGNSTDQERGPVSHISLGGSGLTGHGVYNTVVGKKSEHERDTAAYPQYNTASHGGIANAPVTTGDHGAGNLGTSQASALPGQSTSTTHSQPSAVHDHSTSGHGVSTTAGASAAAIAAQQAFHKHDQHAAGSSTQHTGTSAATQSSNVRDLANSEVSNTHGGSTSTTGPHKSSLLNKLDPRVKSDAPQSGSSESHHGRDAALAGATGAAGVGAYQSSKHHEPNTATHASSAQPATTHGTTTQTTGSAAPHSSGLMNKLDPRVKSDTTQPEHQDHHGRDAALTGGAGAAGAGAYESSKHHHGTGHTDATAAESSTGSATTGPHKSNILNKLDPRVDSNPSAAKQHDEHHHGRDAALIGGTGAAGAGLYEANKHHGHESTQQPLAHHTGSTTAPVGTESGKDKMLHNLGMTTEGQQARSGDVTGREAALTSGTGAATHGNEKHHHSGTSTGTTEHEKKPGLLTKLGLKSDPNEKSSKLQKQSPQESHTGRDTALVGGTAAASGVGAHEIGKHHDQHHAVDPTTINRDTTGTTSATSDTQKPGLWEKLGLKHEHPEQTTGREHETHHGRDAALVGGAGAAGAGAYAATKHHHDAEPITSTSGTTAATTGTHHAADPTTSTTHHAIPAAATSAGTTSHTGHHEPAHQTSTTHPAHRDTSHQEKENKPGLLTKLGLKHDKTDEHAHTDSHKGRDAALVGGAGAAGVGAYEAGKHRHESADPATSTHFPQHDTHHDKTKTSHHHDHGTHHDTKSSSHHQSHSKHEDDAHKPGLLTKLGLKHDKTNEPVEKESHHGRDAAVAGGTGAALGAGAYEAGQHHHGQTGQHDPSATASTTTSTTTTTSGPQYTGPASKTIGPHESNVANVLDPRVQPQPELMKQHQHTGDRETAGAAGLAGGAAAASAAHPHDTTAGTTYPTNTATGPASHTVGPHNSSAANVADPRVQSHPTQHTSSTTEPGYAHDQTSSGLTSGGVTDTLGRSGTTKERHGIAISEDEHHRNKLHKEPKEKKEGFVSKILHGKSDKHGEDEGLAAHPHGHHESTLGDSSTTTGTGASGTHGTV